MEKTPKNKMIGNSPIAKKDMGYEVKPKVVKKTKKEKKVKEETKPEETKETKEEVKNEETDKAVEIIREIVVENPRGVSELNLDRGKIELLKNTIAKGATDDELKMFINVCTGMGLSPFLNQVHMVKRWNSKIGKEVASIQVGIDGFRSIAENTGAYAGNTDPIMGEDIDADGGFKAPSTATVTVFKMVQGVKCEFTATARWTEFYPGPKMGFMWKKMPNVMLGKCAEAQALRKAFPKVLGGVYATEEMDQADNDTKALKKPTAMQIAYKLIKDATDTKEIEDFKNRIGKSKAYNAEQKKQLSDIIETKLSELNNNQENNVEA